MTTPGQIEIKEFAQRVERLCDFFLSRVSEETGRNGSNDQKVIEDLKEDAADIQCDRVQVKSETLDGLYDYMHGADIVPEETN